MPVHGIPESAPIDDGPPNGGDSWLASERQGQPEADRRLLKGRDEVQLSPPGQGAMGIVQGCLLDAIADSLGVPRRAGSKIRPWELSSDPVIRAEQICSDAGGMLQAALAGRKSDVETLLVEGARQGMEHAMDILAKLGHLDGPSGEVVTKLVAAWAAQLARLAESVGEE